MQGFQDLTELLPAAATERDRIISEANSGADDDLAIEDRPNRAEVAPGCKLKFGDQILVFGDTHLVLCPGRGIGFAYTWQYMEESISLGQAEAQYVSDRIPLDPEEEPMPIFDEPAP